MSSAAELLARLFAAKGRPQAAAAVYERLLRDAGLRGEARAKLLFNLAQALTQHADALRSAGEGAACAEWRERAVCALRECLCAHAALPEAHLNLSGLLLKLQRPQDACVAAEAGLAADSRLCGPIRLQLVTNLNVALRQLHRRSEAIRRTWALLGIDFQLHTLLPDGPDGGHDGGDTLTLVCVKAGRKYSAEYVNRLHRMARAQWRPRVGSAVRRLRVVCLTDDPTGLDERVEVLPLPDAPAGPAPGWWRKIEVFAPAVAPRGAWVLYLDLDTVLAAFSLSDVIDRVQEAQGQRGGDSGARRIFFLDAQAFSNEGRPRGINSSAMVFRAGAFTALNDFFAAHRAELTSTLHKFDHFLEMVFHEAFADPEGPAQAAQELGQSQGRPECGADGPHGGKQERGCPGRPLAGADQAAEVEALCLQDLGADWVLDMHDAERLPRDEIRGIVCFPLRPKPHELPDGHVLKSLWTQEG